MNPIFASTITSVESSLDQFARTRGAAMIGLSSMGRAWKFQTVFGGVFVAIAAGIAAVPLFGPPWQVAFASLGPAIAGGTNLAMGLYFRKTTLKNGPELVLSEEARALLQALVMRAQVWQSGRKTRRAFGTGRGPFDIRPAVPPTPEAMDALERAADAHNRLSNALGELKDERSVRLRAAADAGIAEALEQAARAESVNLDEMERTVERMNELADRVVADVRRPDPVSALRSTLDATLEELRAEDVARQELRGG